MAKSPSISELASSVADTGRRGAPKTGCDCMQCFGYCMIDADNALRTRALQGDGGYRSDTAPLNFVDGAR